MFDRLFATGSIPVLEAMLAYASARHRAIATNIANVDTVGFRTLEVPERDFRRALGRALGGEAPGAPLVARPEAPPGPVKPGGNNVDLELEMVKMTENTLLQSTSTALLAAQFGLLREAISGHVA